MSVARSLSAVFTDLVEEPWANISSSVKADRAGASEVLAIWGTKKKSLSFSVSQISSLFVL